MRGAKGKGAEAGEGKPDLEEWLPGEPPGGLAKVSVNTKLYKEFTELRMVQELQAHQGAVWAMKFSQDGKYLASAGQDSIVRIWTLAPVLSPSTAGDKAKKPVQDFFEAEPYRLYVGHKADVLDLSWSKTQFLLSSSMDKTVRLWHISMEECLRVFNHSDFVTAVDFHPIDDKYFLSGSLDEKLRLWNIPDHTVRDWVNVHEMVTAACFSPDGKQAIVGSYKGKCRFYQTEGMKFEYVTQIDVKSTRGSSRGKKITGLEYMPGVDKLLLITSNDSRIRMYDGYTLKTKYKGHKNANSQIQATFSPGGGYVVCGSEDGGVFLWSTINTFIPSVNPYYTGYRKEKNSSYEAFRCGQAPASRGTPRARPVRQLTPPFPQRPHQHRDGGRLRPGDGAAGVQALRRRRGGRPHAGGGGAGAAAARQVRAGVPHPEPAREGGRRGPEGRGGGRGRRRRGRAGGGHERVQRGDPHLREQRAAHLVVRLGSDRART